MCTVWLGVVMGVLGGNGGDGWGYMWFWVGNASIFFCSTWKPLSNCDFSSTVVVVDVVCSLVYKDHDNDGATIGKSGPARTCSMAESKDPKRPKRAQKGPKGPKEPQRTQIDPKESIRAQKIPKEPKRFQKSPKGPRWPASKYVDRPSHAKSWIEMPFWKSI